MELGIAGRKYRREDKMENIITAVVSGLCVAIPSIVATVSANKRSNDLVIYRINELDRKYTNIIT